MTFLNRWLPALALLLWGCAALPASPAGATEAAGHRFELDTAGWPEQPESVTLAGTFNGWDKFATPMQRDADGVWAVTMDLDDGVCLYKFVINGSRWLKDPVHSDASLEEPDGHQGMNSAVMIGADARHLPPPEPDAIKPEPVRHDPTRFQNRSVVSEELLLLAVEAQRGDVVKAEVLTLQAQAGAAPAAGADTAGVAESLDASAGAEPSDTPAGAAAEAGSGAAWVTHALASESASLGIETFVGLLKVQPGEVRYCFALHDGQAALYLGRSGTHETLQAAQADAFTVEMTPSFATPDWAKHAVWYQVFPERFRNGNPGNDPGDLWYENLLPWTSDWWKTYPQYGEAPGQKNFYEGEGNVWKRRYGGDLQGLREALPYLRELGANAIYLNPIFEATSMHKYDTADFRHVDDNFGERADTSQYPPALAGETDDPATWGWTPSDRVFLDFLKEAKAQGFKVVIDGVFNHVGIAHPFFQDVLAKGPKSRYADWFEITDWGDPKNWHPMADPLAVHGKPGGIQWNAWDKPSGHLPVFKNDPDTGLAEGPRAHIFAITRRWLDPNGDGDPSDGVDGWRLDVPGDIAHPFWIEWRKLVKGINPDAYISGEIWPWAHPWLKGDQFDAVMNYQFATPAIGFFADRKNATKPSTFAARLNRVVYNYPMQVALAQMNLFDSHDTDRVASMFVNPDRPYDGANRIQDSNPDYDPREPTAMERRRQMQAVAFQMTFVGAPMIYYGTEAGMWGPDDPSDRMPMVWEDLQPYEGKGVRFRRDLFEGYRRLIAIRHTLPVLRIGGFRVVLTEDDRGVIVFERKLGEARAIVVVNRSRGRRRVTVPAAAGRYVDLMREKNAVVVEPAAAGGANGAAGSAAGRATVRLTDDADVLFAAGGEMTVMVPSYGTAILVPTRDVPGGEAP